jgi:hypothetical protein
MHGFLPCDTNEKLVLFVLVGGWQPSGKARKAEALACCMGVYPEVQEEQPALKSVKEPPYRPQGRPAVAACAARCRSARTKGAIRRVRQIQFIWLRQTDGYL